MLDTRAKESQIYIYMKRGLQTRIIKTKQGFPCIDLSAYLYHNKLIVIYTEAGKGSLTDVSTVTRLL